MYYVVWRNPNIDYRIGGFILDGDEENPKAWETEEEAKEAMKGHILEPYSQVIEL